MRRYSIIACIALLVVAGCGQGAGNAPSDPTEPTISPRGSGERATTAEQTATDGGLECAGGMGVSGVVDYAPGAKGEKANPVELARRDFSKNIEEGDEVVPERDRNRGTVP